MPIHNYYFTKEIIPLTIAAYKDWNLGAKPMDYIMFLISLFNKIFSKKTPYSDFSFSGCLRQVKFDDKYLDTIINCIDYFISNFNF